jgi:ribosomal protein S18 acetylase RimI-like enzyme
MMFVIREFKEPDSQGLILLLREQFKETPPSRLEKRASSCLKAMEAKASTLLLAFSSNNLIVGYILIQWMHELWADSPEAFISSLFVHEEWRLKGVGNNLLEAAIQEAQKRDCARIFLENNRNNSIYHKNFYAKRGWEEKEGISVFEYPHRKT